MTSEVKCIFMRHGQSVWNEANLFTGWVDIPLSEKGRQEAREGGKKIAHLPIDLVFTSTLIRAQETVLLALAHHSDGKIPVFLHPHEGEQGEWEAIYSPKAKEGAIPVYRAWQLNERRYGQLQGLNKAETAEKFGAEQVQLWRRSYDTAPPEGESLAMTSARTLPYFHKQIVPRLQEGKHVFVAAHGNSLRSILMDIERLSPEEVVRLELATGEPLIYTYSKGLWRRDLSR